MEQPTHQPQHMPPQVARGQHTPAPEKPSAFKTTLRPALGWLFFYVIFLVISLTVYVVAIDRVTYVDAIPVIVVIIGALAVPVTTWVFSRGKEKIAGVAEGNAADDWQSDIGRDYPSNS